KDADGISFGSGKDCVTACAVAGAVIDHTTGGAQPYWSTKATMPMHTKGILMRRRTRRWCSPASRRGTSPVVWRPRTTSASAATVGGEQGPYEGVEGGDEVEGVYGLPRWSVGEGIGPDEGAVVEFADEAVAA